MSFPTEPTPALELRDPLMESKGIRVLIKRDDLTHPLIQGNKWRKLKHNLKEAKRKRIQTLISYGGAYSNHIVSLAAAGKTFDFKTIGIIRGEELNFRSNPSLEMAHNMGMKLYFVTREDYREYNKSLTVPIEVDETVMILPEGGTNDLAIAGTSEILAEVTEPYDIVCSPYGTGGTAAGLLKSMKPDHKLWVFSALKGESQQEEFHHILKNAKIPSGNYVFYDDKRFGGYAKFNDDLLKFIKNFYSNNGILLDPIYTGKMFFSVWELAKNDQIAIGSTLLLVHTGGLQGIAGFNHRFNLALPNPEVI